MDENTRDDVATWLHERNITSIRIEGTNLDGSLLGKRISPAKFLAGLATGFSFADVAFGLDLQNTPYSGFALPNWRGDMPDILLDVDLDTLTEWKPGHASVIGNFHSAQGVPISACPRGALARMTQRAAGEGFGVHVAVEIEATLFEESIQEARAKNYQNLTPLGGTAGSAYHLVKSGDWEQFMERVVERLNQIGIAWEAWNDEAAAGQIELNLPVGEPVAVADAWARTRQVMREVAWELGRSVTFMAKWCGQYGQGTHLNLSLTRDESNAFYAADGPSLTMRHFIGGAMDCIAATTSFALPWITSYRRLVDLDGPPTTATWGIANKTTAIRAVVGHPSQSRIEYRLPGSDSNVYLVLAALLGAGLSGIRDELEPPAPYPSMAWCVPPEVPRLPDTISRAAHALTEDKRLRAELGEELVDYWIGMRQWEWMMFHTAGGDPDATVSDWELTRYFELV